MSGIRGFGALGAARRLSKVLVVSTVLVGSLAAAGPASAHGTVYNDGFAMCTRAYAEGARKVTVTHQTTSGAMYVRFHVFEASSMMWAGRGWVASTPWMGSNGQTNKWLYNYQYARWSTASVITIRSFGLESAYGPVMNAYAEVYWRDGHTSTHFVGGQAC